VWLTNTQTKALARISEKSLAPVSAIVRHAVEEYLRKRITRTKSRIPQRRRSAR